MGFFDALNNMFECMQGVDVESVIEQQRKLSLETRLKNAVEGGGYTTSCRIISDLVLYDGDLYTLPSSADFQLSAKGRVIIALKSAGMISKVKFRSVDGRGDRSLVVVRAPEVGFSECIFDGKNSRNALETNCKTSLKETIVRNCGGKDNPRNVVEVVRREGARRRSDMYVANLKLLRCKSTKSLLSVVDDLSGTYYSDKCVAGQGLFAVGGKMNVSLVATESK